MTRDVIHLSKQTGLLSDLPLITCTWLNWTQHFSAQWGATTTPGFSCAFPLLRAKLCPFSPDFQYPRMWLLGYRGFTEVITFKCGHRVDPNWKWCPRKKRKLGHRPVQSESEWSCSVMSDSLWPLEPTRLLRAWDFPGKNTGVGCHFLFSRSSWPRDWTRVSHIVRRRFTVWATREVQWKIQKEDSQMGKGLWRNQPSWHLDLRLPASRIVRKSVSVV